MDKEEIHKQKDFALNVQEGKQEIVAVQSRKKLRKTCIVAVVLMLLIGLSAAIVVPLVLMDREDSSSGWSYWTFCSVTCGNGTRMRRRICPTCQSKIESKVCVTPDCVEPPHWEEWSQWSFCSKTCSVGVQVRQRNCSHSNCEGDNRQAKNCVMSPTCAKTDCLGWLRSGHTSDGLYLVNPDNQGSFPVYCDMKTNGGGWTVFQRRLNGSEDLKFHRNWTDYKTGFGNLTGEFWLGNDKIHRLTSLNVSLLINIDDWSGKQYNASYDVFIVSNENSSYTLTVSKYSGNAGNSLSYHNGMKFTTNDRDNDREGASNCAVGYTGGWWFNACIKSNLNGKNVGNRPDRQGIIWMNNLSGLSFDSMKETEMKLRPRKN